MGTPDNDPTIRPEVRWGLGCLVGAVALLGLLILIMLVAFVLSPPKWLQVLIGVLLALGGLAFAWLVASSLGRGERERETPTRSSTAGG